MHERVGSERPADHQAIAEARFRNQLLLTPSDESPAAVVRWLGAVQAQDYGPAKWTIGLRLREATDQLIEQAFNEGLILRTHVMRPTWHFVPAEDLGWMLSLTAPRVHAANARAYRSLGLDEDVLRRSDRILASEVAGNQRTREELRRALHRSGLPVTQSNLFSLVLMHAELEGVICSGGRRGREFTYASLEERVPNPRRLDRSEGLIELARRYMRSHGPATLRDLVWWSGLTAVDARKGLQEAEGELERRFHDGREYWLSAASDKLSSSGLLPASSVVHLLPTYDEFRSYQDRHDILDESGPPPALLREMVVVNGRVAGTWRAAAGRDHVEIRWQPFRPFSPAEEEAVFQAAARYSAFIGRPVDVSRSAGPASPPER